MLWKEDLKGYNYSVELFLNSVIYQTVFSNQYQMSADQFRIEFPHQTEIGLEVLCVPDCNWL